jgi:hypothetical protein
MAWRDRLQEGLRYLGEQVGRVSGETLVPTERLSLLEQAEGELRVLARDYDLFAWSVLDYMSGQPQEVRPETRRKWAQRARFAWMNDPMAGAAVDLLNDFVFGRGVTRPRARDEAVQDVIDEAWDDPDNKAVLTSYSAQIALGTDLALQSNLFLLMFDDGGDGLVKLGLLNHDSVVNVVRDPDNRLRVLYYVAKVVEQEWDFTTDSLKATDQTEPRTLYYPHWENVTAEEKDRAERDRPLPTPPRAKTGDGKVMHIAVNRTSEMAFGVPTMQRTLRWFSAYNDFMASRVDMTKAAAAFVMRKQVKGTPGQLEKLAQKATNRRSDLAAQLEAAATDGQVEAPGRPGGTVWDNEQVTTESFKMDSGAGNAAQDALMLRAQVSAATRFPQHYLGDQGSANLATATSMELPVQKLVESRQELFESIFRAFTDRVIERAVEVGRISEEVEDDADDADEATLGEAPLATATTAAQPAPAPVPGETQSPDAATADAKADDATVKSVEKKRDLTYEFKMPNPLRRLMSDLVAAISQIATTFDPNGTNMELSRTLLTVALGEALEIVDPAEAVERIFPPGYQDPMMAQAMQPPGPPAAPADGSVPIDQLQGDQSTGGSTVPAPGGMPGSGMAGPYGTKSQGTLPEQAWGSLQQAAQQGDDALTSELRAIVEDAADRILAETRFKDLPDPVRARIEAQRDGTAKAFQEEVMAPVLGIIDDLLGTTGRA